MKRKDKIVLSFLLVAGLLSGFLTGCSSEKSVGVQRHFHLVFDVSGSMAGQNGTMEKVKRNSSKLLDTFEPGDVISVYTFAGDTKLVKTWNLTSKSDSQEIQDFISNLDPKGLYTDMRSLLDTLRQKVEAEGENGEIKQFVVVLTDGRDDPSPSGHRERTDLEKYRGTGPVTETFVYYINLGKLRDPVLEEGLKSISSSVKVVEKKETEKATRKAAEKGQSISEANTVKEKPSGETGQVTGKEQANAEISRTDPPGVSSEIEEDEIGLGEVAQDIQTITLERSLPDLIIKAVVGGLLFVLGLWIILFWFFRKAGSRISGTLSIRQFGTPAYSARVVRLDKFKTSRITLGDGKTSMIKVKDLGTRSPVIFKSRTAAGHTVLVPGGKSSASVKIRDGKKIINPGDEFTIGNYIFEYGDGQKR